MAFSVDQESGFGTAPAQEIGNRFLRLPELHSDSANKNDYRSDLSACVGMLFYLLTQIKPRVLLDEQGRYPHQREPASQRLHGSGIPQIEELKALFDQGFQIKLDDRFQSAVALQERLRACMRKSSGGEDSNSLMTRIRERAASAERPRVRSALAELHAIGGQIYKLTDEIVRDLGGVFTIVGSSNQTDAADLSYIYRVGFIYSFKTAIMLIPDYIIQNIGSEIIVKVRIAGKFEYSFRCPATQGHLDAQTVEGLRTFLLGKLDEIAGTH